MILMFRRTTFLCFGLIVFGNLILLSFDSTLHPIMMFLISFIIAATYAVKLINEIAEICTQKCDPYEFIERYEKVLKRRIGKARTFVLISLSSGYLTAGNSQKAKQILDSVSKVSNNKAGILNKTCYFNNLCSYYLQVNDITNAESMLENMLEVLKNEKYPKQNYDLVYNFYIGKQYLINIAKGNYTGAEEVFSIQFNREKNKLGRVVAKYHLGKVYLNFNKLEEATEAFEYVVNNGNKTCYVDEAIDFINQCKAGEPT